MHVASRGSHGVVRHETISVAAKSPRSTSRAGPASRTSRAVAVAPPELPGSLKPVRCGTKLMRLTPPPFASRASARANRRRARVSSCIGAGRDRLNAALACSPYASHVDRSTWEAHERTRNTDARRGGPISNAVTCRTGGPESHRERYESPAAGRSLWRQARASFRQRPRSVGCARPFGTRDSIRTGRFAHRLRG
jgi:hypothetical protein